MSCPHCNDTGSLSKERWDFYDCAHCGAADERVQLEAWANREGLDCDTESLWSIYQRGKTAAQPA